MLYNNQEPKDDCRGRNHNFSGKESYLLMLIKLRRNMSGKHRSHLSEASESTVSNSVITWMIFMHLRLNQKNT